MVIVNCAYCNKEINKLPYEIRKNKENFCSNLCLGFSKRKTNLIEVFENYAEIIIEDVNLGEFRVLVDIEDVERIKDIYWRVRQDPRHPNCTTYVENKHKNKRIHIHRLLTNCPAGYVVDHINGNGLDNRKENLRICCQSVNSLNRRIRNKGVSFCNTRGKWASYVCIKGKTKHLGYYEKEEDAHKIRAYADSLIKDNRFDDVFNIEINKFFYQPSMYFK